MVTSAGIGVCSWLVLPPAASWPAASPRADAGAVGVVVLMCVADKRGAGWLLLPAANADIVLLGDAADVLA